MFSYLSFISNLLFSLGCWFCYSYFLIPFDHWAWMLHENLLIYSSRNCKWTVLTRCMELNVHMMNIWLVWAVFLKLVEWIGWIKEKLHMMSLNRLQEFLYVHWFKQNGRTFNNPWVHERLYVLVKTWCNTRLFDDVYTYIFHVWFMNCIDVQLY